MSRERKTERMEVGKQIFDALFGNAFHRIPPAQNADILVREPENPNFASFQ
jgi:hypothetical protein